jgi:hypothetical protein
MHLAENRELLDPQNSPNFCKCDLCRLADF